MNTEETTTEKEPAGYIDMTPTWESLVRHIATIYVEGTTAESRKIGEEELVLMARAADQLIQLQKEGRITGL